MAMMVIGVILQGFWLSLLRQINMGTDPCSLLTQGVEAHVPLSFGTVGNMVCLGYISDFFSWIWRLALPVCRQK